MEWLTGLAVREIGIQITQTLPPRILPLDQPDNGYYNWSLSAVSKLLDDRERLVGLVKELLPDAEWAAEEYGARGETLSKCYPEIIKARACLKAQKQ